jgi:hypothetical protein
VVQVDGAPPTRGKSILAIIGWMTKRRPEPRKTVAPQRRLARAPLRRSSAAAGPFGS